ncbi:MFS transporter [Flexivirga caeni]|uniref:MFS transporter n=1 Tax=Flexivirga caeni TaxID=2294115 RepID=A0A3M9MHA3_9MICO|nr:MFS transporter [Flexivirga caeni]RNI24874.1 MFS transporter [Flexivirga caeni]
MTTQAVTAERLPPAYVWWASAAAASTLGSSAFGFAMTWYSAGISAGFTGVIGVLMTLPTAALLLLGGVAADRFGIRRMLVAGDALMLVLSAFAVLSASLAGVHPWLLVVVAIVTGIEGAFYLPATGVVPRLFATEDALPRATALNSTLSQLARIAGPPCGALAVSAVAFTGTAVVDGVTFAAILMVLLCIRPPYAPAASTSATPGSMLQPLGTVWRTPALRSVLVTTGVAAAGVLPTMIYGPSLLSRQSGWGPGASGLIEAGWLVGGIIVTATIARCGTARRIDRAVAVGLLLITLGLTGFAVCPSAATGFVSTVVVGIGVSVCTGHLWPAYLQATPLYQLGRYQALLVFAQMTTLLVATIAFTAIADELGARWAIALCAALLLVTLVWWAAGSGWSPADRARKSA